MEDYDRQKIEKYRQYLKDEIAGCEEIAECENIGEETAKQFWYRRTGYQFALEEFDKLFPEPVYFPAWVRYVGWALIVFILAFMYAICSYKK